MHLSVSCNCCLACLQADFHSGRSAEAPKACLQIEQNCKVENVWRGDGSGYTKIVGRGFSLYKKEVQPRGIEAIQDKEKVKQDVYITKPLYELVDSAKHRVQNDVHTRPISFVYDHNGLHDLW